MPYKNFIAAVYCPVGNLIDINDIDAFAKKFAFIEKHVNVGKVYLETYRSGRMIEREKMEALKAFFMSRGIAISGGITTTPAPSGGGGFDSFCYTDSESRKLLTQISEFTAGLFDEIILDDFYFTNCRCESCIKAKGNRSWADFRLSLMNDISENVIVGPAKRVNPKVKMVIKYPNWYEHFQETGYNLKDEPKIFDMIYTGTETRNPTYTQQNLPKYLSYFNMRYMENVAPGRNGGGWFDPYECSYNLTSYADQAYLTLFSKPAEAALFSLGSLLSEEYSLNAPIAGQVFSDMDKYLGDLGRPVGTACYLPYHSHGEDFIHNYLGMAGIPLEPSPDYPEKASTLFLAESSACDPDIIDKIKKSLMAGARVIVTSGFVRASEQKFRDIVAVTCTAKKAKISKYAFTLDGGLRFGGCEDSDKEIIIPQVEFPTNDTWKLIGAFGEDTSFPILLKTDYGKGVLYILTVPDDLGDLYNYPRTIINQIRDVFSGSRISLDAVSRQTLFTYDNNTFILRSFLPYADRVAVTIKGEPTALKDLSTGREIQGFACKYGTVFEFTLAPSVNRIFRIV